MSRVPGLPRWGPFVVGEPVEGAQPGTWRFSGELEEDLSALGARLSPDQALAFAWHLAAALAELHERGVAHGALHPASIGLDALGALRVRPALAEPFPADPDPSAGAMATDCLRLADCFEALQLGRHKDPAIPLLMSALRRRPARLRLSPGRAVRQALAAVLARRPQAEVALVDLLGHSWRLEDHYRDAGEAGLHAPRPAPRPQIRVAGAPPPKPPAQRLVLTKVSVPVAEVLAARATPAPVAQTPARVAQTPAPVSPPPLRVELQIEPAPSAALDLAEPDMELEPAAPAALRFHPEDVPTPTEAPLEDEPTPVEAPYEDATDEQAAVEEFEEDSDQHLIAPTPILMPRAALLGEAELELHTDKEFVDDIDSSDEHTDDEPTAPPMTAFVPPPPRALAAPVAPAPVAPAPVAQAPVAQAPAPIPPAPAPDESIPSRDPEQSPKWGEARGVGASDSREAELGMGKWTEAARPLAEVAASMPQTPSRPLDMQPEPSRWPLWLGAALLLAGLLSWALT